MPLTPRMFSPGSHNRAWWKCDQGHEWEATIHNRTEGTACPYCDGKRVGADNTLALKYPDLTREWHPTKNGELTPYHVTPKSHTKVWWICGRGHEWKTRVSHRTGGSGCPICYSDKRSEIGSKRQFKTNESLADKYPDLSREWHPTKNGKLTPHDVTPGSNRKVWWKCSQGHEWTATIYNRRSGTGCPYCAGKRASEDNNFAVRYPEMVKDWHPTKNGQLTPYDVAPKSHKKVWWVCSQGHEWETAVVNRARGSGCPICYNERRRSM